MLEGENIQSALIELRLRGLVAVFFSFFIGLFVMSMNYVHSSLVIALSGVGASVMLIT